MDNTWRSAYSLRPGRSRENYPSMLMALVCAVVRLFGRRSGSRVRQTGEKDGKYVFVESMDPSMRLLLERSVKSGMITQEEYDRVVQDSEERSQLLMPSFKGWYDRGFNLSFNDNAFFLKIRFRAQLRFTRRFRNDAWRNPGEAKNFPELLGVFGDYRANRSENDAILVQCCRRRFYFMGHLFDPDFKYYIQFRSETAENAQTPGALSLLDMNFTSTHFKWANVQLGQYKVYFNRSQINSTASLQFADRSLVQDAFTASGLDRRDIGITIMNDEELFPINYYFGVFNGAGPSFNRLGSFAIGRTHRWVVLGDKPAGNPFPLRRIARSTNAI